MVEAAQEAGVVVRTGVEVTRVVVRGGRAVGVVTADGTGRRGAPGGRRRRRADACWPATSSASSTCRGSGSPRCAGTARPRATSGSTSTSTARRRGPTSGSPTAPSCTSPATSTSSPCRRRRSGGAGCRRCRSSSSGSRTAPTRPACRRARRACGSSATARPRPVEARTATGRRGFADRVLDRLEAHAPGLREQVVDTTVAAAAGAAGARPEPRRRRRRRRLRLARPAAGLPAGRRLVVVRAAGRAGCGCAARPRTRAAACTGCAGATPRGRSCGAARLRPWAALRSVAQLEVHRVGVLPVAAPARSPSA